MIEQLLKYHQTLASTEFVEKLMQRIERQFRIRYRVLGLFTVLGIVAGAVGFIKVWPSNFTEYIAQLDQTTMILFSSLLAGFGAFLFWLLNDEFERP